jgi:AGZA family xanthine/uracil permease-like MFS transporter
MNDTRLRYPIWVKGDLDGFFGLMVDNLVQVLTIVALSKLVAGLSDGLIFGRVLPGIAVSLLIGNLFYGVQAHVAARRHRNAECTALPYGINTPSVFAFIFFVMGPVYQQTGDGDLAWKAGLMACLVSGVIEFVGAFFAEKLRRVTPRAALLGVLAAVGITFIAADFAFRIFTSPLVAMVPLAILLLAYFGRYRFPMGLPGGLLAVVFGAGMAWASTSLGFHTFGGVAMFPEKVKASLDSVGWMPPIWCGSEIAELFTRTDLIYAYLTVSIPMGLINVIGSLQNIESAEAGGDRFATGPSLAVNGLGTVAAGLFGSCFPTTIYIGHPGWKALGARSGYSILNGLFFSALFLFGLGPLLAAIIPVEAGAAIVMYIGIVITAQAFQATPRNHAPAVAISLFPALAAMLVIVMSGYLVEAGATRSFAELMQAGTPATVYLPGLMALTGANSSWIVVTLILTAIAATLIDRHYRGAAVWAGVGAVLTAAGLLHAYRLDGNAIHELFIWQPAPAPGDNVYAYRAFPIAVGYALAAILFAAAARRGSGADESGASTQA